MQFLGIVFMLTYVAVNVFLAHVTRKRTMREEKEYARIGKGLWKVCVMETDRGDW